MFNFHFNRFQFDIIGNGLYYKTILWYCSPTSFHSTCYKIIVHRVKRRLSHSRSLCLHLYRSSVNYYNYYWIRINNKRLQIWFQRHFGFEQSAIPRWYIATAVFLTKIYLLFKSLSRRLNKNSTTLRKLPIIISSHPWDSIMSRDSYGFVKVVYQITFFRLKAHLCLCIIIYNMDQ